MYFRVAKVGSFNEKGEPQIEKSAGFYFILQNRIFQEFNPTNDNFESSHFSAELQISFFEYDDKPISNQPSSKQVVLESSEASQAHFLNLDSALGC
jgi:hypothetical protein